MIFGCNEKFKSENMKRLLLLLGTMVLFGCSSMADMRTRAPDARFTSTKDINDVSECILFGWQENSGRYGSVFIQPFNNGGKTVYGTTEFVDLNKLNKGVSVNFYHNGGTFWYRVDSRVKNIRKCI